MGSSAEPTLVDPTARLVYEAIQRLGRDAEPEQLADAVKRLELGLPAEDEFSVLLCWLGRCRLVHKLDQHQAPPGSKEQYRIPDLLVVFDLEDHRIAALVEVKATKGDSLSWRPDYYEALQRYGEQLGLPVLVAWKWKPAGLWALFELRNFERTARNYKLAFKTAAKQNLMGLLAGDFVVAFKSGAGLHIRMRKVEKLGHHEGENKVPVEWLVRVEDAYFTNGEGARVDKLGPGLWPLLLSAPLEEESRFEEGYITQSFVIPAGELAEWAHRAMVVLLEFFQDGVDSPLNWREILLNQRVPIECSVLRKAAQEGISKGFVRYVLRQEPITKPDFLS